MLSHCVPWLLWRMQSGQAGAAEDRGGGKAKGVFQQGDTVSQFKGARHEGDRPAHFKDRGFKQGERVAQYTESSLTHQTVMQPQSGDLDYKERGVHHQGEKAAQFSDGGLFEQVERPTQLTDVVLFEQGERTDQVRDRDTSTRKMLHELSEDVSNECMSPCMVQHTHTHTTHTHTHTLHYTSLHSMQKEPNQIYFDLVCVSREHQFKSIT